MDGGCFTKVLLIVTIRSIAYPWPHSQAGYLRKTKPVMAL